MKWKGPTEYQSLRFAVLRRDQFTCRYCGAKAPNVQLHIDHVLPKSRGGQNTPSNLVTACVDCNEGKAAIKMPRRTRQAVTGEIVCSRCNVFVRGIQMTPGGKPLCAPCRKASGVERVGCDRCPEYFWLNEGCRHFRRHGYDRLCGCCCSAVSSIRPIAEDLKGGYGGDVKRFKLALEKDDEQVS